MQAPLSVAWRCSVNLDDALNYVDEFESYTAVSGEPGQAGSVVTMHLDCAGNRVDSEVTTLERVEFERLVQLAVSEGQASTVVTEFEPDGFDATKIRQTMTMDLSDIPFWKRPMIKVVTRMALFVTIDDFIEYTEEQAVAELAGVLEVPLNAD